jgi:NO-binding membrane sensor protein with MHYT domain
MNMVVTYNPWLVTLSYLIAVVASFTALELGSRVTRSQLAAFAFRLRSMSIPLGSPEWWAEAASWC